jgi:hypothetical protein
MALQHQAKNLGVSAASGAWRRKPKAAARRGMAKMAKISCGEWRRMAAPRRRRRHGGGGGVARGEMAACRRGVNSIGGVWRQRISGASAAKWRRRKCLAAAAHGSAMAGGGESRQRKSAKMANGGVRMTRRRHGGGVAACIRIVDA